MRIFNIYEEIGIIAKTKFEDIVASVSAIGGKARLPNKLRIFFYDDSFLDIWLSIDGDYCVAIREILQFARSILLKKN